MIGGQPDGPSRFSTEVVGGYDFGPMIAIAVAVLGAAATGLVLLIWGLVKIARDMGGGRMVLVAILLMSPLLITLISMF